MLRSERGNILLKLLDRWIGIPFVILLSLFKKKHSTPILTPQRIGLLIPAAIGDTIVASPVFDALRARFPNAEIVVFASSTNMAIFPLLKNFSRVVNLPIKKPWKAIAILQNQNRFDWWIDFGQWARLNAVYSFFSKSDFKVGFKTENQFRHFIYDQSVLHSDKVHELENFNRLLSPFKMKINHEPVIKLQEIPIKKNQILIHIFAGGSKPYLKEWPLQNWKNVIDYFTQKHFEIILTGTKENRAAGAELIAAVQSPNNVFNAAGAWNLERVAQEMLASHAVVSVNTGVMHLAAALGCNLVSLQGPTSVKRWGPLGQNSKAIQSSLACSPCLNLGFDYGCPYNNCMKAISVDQVLNLLQPK